MHFNVKSIKICFVGISHSFGEDVLWSSYKTNNPRSQGKLWTHGWYQVFVDLGCSATSSRCCESLGCFVKFTGVYVCEIARILSLCISYVNKLYCINNAFISYAFSCFKKICDLSHESILLRWHPNMNDCVEHLVFEAHLSTSVGSHLNATCIDYVTYLRSFVTRELFNRTISEVKVEVVSMCLFLVLFFLCFYFFWLYRGIASISMGLMCWFLLADAAAMMVMELESKFSPSKVMDALSTVYPRF